MFQNLINQNHGASYFFNFITLKNCSIVLPVADPEICRGGRWLVKLAGPHGGFFWLVLTGVGGPGLHPLDPLLSLLIFCDKNLLSHSGRSRRTYFLDVCPTPQHFSRRIIRGMRKHTTALKIKTKQKYIVASINSIISPTNCISTLVKKINIRLTRQDLKIDKKCPKYQKDHVAILICNKFQRRINKNYTWF